MIPITYRLRRGIRFEDRGGFTLVISEVPLSVIRTQKCIARLLQVCSDQKTVSQIALEAGIADEEQVLRICDYFNKKAILESAFISNPGYFPYVTVIIPTFDRGTDLAECLASVFSQDYPEERFEVIVIDDGSCDQTQKLVSAFPCLLLRNEKNMGQAYCRNLGAARARGEMLAFLDSDCVADPGWLRELVPCFLWEKVGAVGGYVGGYFCRTGLDRYEQKFSLLNLGEYIQWASDDKLTLYVPTCNMLVRKKAFFETGGIRTSLRLGEDVDFCWRMRETGWHLLYVPAGKVRHKHRRTLGSMLRRRLDYGFSEGMLYSLHPQKRKTVQVRALAAVGFAGVSISLLLLTPTPLLATAASAAVQAITKTLRLRARDVRVPLKMILLSTIRLLISYSFRIAFHIIRYYLVLLLLFGFLFHSLWVVATALLLFVSAIDYRTKRPQLGFPQFLFWYVLDQVAYQLGAMAGCLRVGSLRSYFPSFLTRIQPVPPALNKRDRKLGIMEKAKAVTGR